MKIRPLRLPLFENILRTIHHYAVEGTKPTKDLVQKSIGTSKAYYNQAVLTLFDLNIIKIQENVFLLPDQLIKISIESFNPKYIILSSLKEFRPYKEYCTQISLGIKPEKAAKLIAAKFNIEENSKDLVDYFQSFSNIIEENEILDRDNLNHNSPNDDRYFISKDRIDSLQEFTNDKFDFSKLIALCRELNSNYTNENYYSVAMLTRAIIDHIPPIFEKRSFSEVANNYGSKSFKEAMVFLDQFARKVSDSYLHGHIRKRENVPNELTVDCRSAVDLLLGEILTVT